MGLRDLNSSPFPPEVLISMSADPRNTSAGGWIHEEEFRQKIAQIAPNEHVKSDKQTITFDTFVKPVSLESTVQTALESVDDLYPHRIGNPWQVCMDRNADTNSSHQNDPGQVSMDRSRAESISEGSGSNSEDVAPSDDFASGPAIKASETTHQEQTDAEGLVSTPINPSEYEEYGIRVAGDIQHLKEDAFEAPKEYLGHNARTANVVKRPRFAAVPNI